MTQFTQYDPADEDFDRVGGKLSAFTLGKGGPKYHPLKFAFKATEDSGKVLGELVGTLLWGQAEVNLLHVEQAARGKGVGKQLLSMVEDFVRSSGGLGVHLWTPSFQGEGFYEKAGYREVSRFPLNTGGYFGDQPQFRITYYKDLQA